MAGGEPLDPPRTDRASARQAQLDELRDELPDDLNAAEFVGVYQFPGNERRRIPAVLYGLAGLAMVIGFVVRRTDAPSLVNRGIGIGGVLFLLLGAYGWAAGAKLNVQDIDALASASTAVGFPVGHASAQLGWRGLLSRPTWRILVYSADSPPSKRGLVLVDGVNGAVVEQVVEPNPEDWSGFTDAEVRGTDG